MVRLTSLDRSIQETYLLLNLHVVVKIPCPNYATTVDHSWISKQLKQKQKAKKTSN